MPFATANVLVDSRLEGRTEEMTIEELKRALVEVSTHCKNYPLPECYGCPFADSDGFCNLTSHPAYWDVDDWEEDSNATD